MLRPCTRRLAHAGGRQGVVRRHSALARGVGGDAVVAASLARLLQQVRDLGQPLAAEVGLTAQLEGLLVGLDEGEAYLIQQQLLGLGEDLCSRQIGWKVGATAAGPQQALCLSGPFSAPLFARQLCSSHIAPDEAAGGGGSATLSLSAMGGLGVTVETELGWSLRKDLPPLPDPAAEYSYEVVHDALGPLCACVEVTARRVAPREGTALGPLVIADGGGCGAVVTSATSLSREQWLDSVDPPAAAVRVVVDGAEVASGVGSAVFGDPVASVQWLATQRGRLGGRGLRTGELIITGTLHGKTEIEAGTVVVSDFGDELGAVEVAFDE